MKIGFLPFYSALRSTTATQPKFVTLFFTRNVERKCQDIIIAVFPKHDRKPPCPPKFNPAGDKFDVGARVVFVVHACSDDIVDAFVWKGRHNR